MALHREMFNFFSASLGGATTKMNFEYEYAMKFGVSFRAVAT